MGLSEVTAFVQPDMFCYGGYTLRYDKVSALVVAGAHAGTTEVRGLTERSLQLPADACRGLLRAFHLAELEWQHPARPQEPIKINCHLLVRLLTGMAESLDAPFAAADAVLAPGNLGAGEPGIVSKPHDPEPYHSVIGLGADEDDSLQEMFGRGAIALCNNYRLLDFMRGFAPQENIDLYRMDR